MTAPGAAEMTDKERRELTRFLELIRSGAGPLNAGVEVGWSPAKVRRLQADPSMVELIDIARDRQLESIEETLNRMAKDGHFKAIQMVLFNRRPERWRDIKHISVEQHGTLDIGVVHSVKQAALELLRDRGVQALQPAAVQREIIEAEVIEDGDRR